MPRLPPDTNSVLPFSDVIAPSFRCFPSISSLVPTFRSSYTVSAITFYELRKAMGTSKFMLLVPLFDLKSLGSFRRLRCRDFKSAALVPTFRSSYTVSAITFYELRKAMGTSKFMILVPLFDLKSLGSFRRSRCRDFKSAALGLFSDGGCTTGTRIRRAKQSAVSDGNRIRRRLSHRLRQAMAFGP